jgi:hypothetical protein
MTAIAVLKDGEVYSKSFAARVTENRAQSACSDNSEHHCRTGADVRRGAGRMNKGNPPYESKSLAGAAKLAYLVHIAARPGHPGPKV